MKQKTLLLILLVNLFVFNAFAQKELKIGYADIEYILNKMPETAKVQEELKGILGTISAKRDSLVKDYNLKFDDFEKNVTTFTPTVKTEKENVMMQLRSDIQRFDSDIKIGLNAKKGEMLKPIYNRIGELIQLVAKENNYTHVINSVINNTSVLLYAEESANISELVIAKAKE